MKRLLFAYVLALWVTVMYARGNEILVLRDAKTESDTVYTQLDPGAIGSRPLVTATTLITYTVIDVSGQQRSVVVSSVGKTFTVTAVSALPYTVFPIKPAGTYLWAYNSFGEASDKGASNYYMTGTASPMRVSLTGSLLDVPRTLEGVGVDFASSKSDVLDDQRRPTGQTSTSIRVTTFRHLMLLQTALTIRANTGAPFVPQGSAAPVTKGTLDYGLELVKALLRARGYSEVAGGG